MATNISNLPSGGRMIKKTYDRIDNRGTSVKYYYTIDPGYTLYENVFIYPEYLSVRIHANYIENNTSVGNLTTAYQDDETELCLHGISLAAAGVTFTYGECYIIYI